MSERSREVHELRAEIRHWRRGRANAKYMDVLVDAYITIFATVMLGSMLANVVVNVRRIGGQSCVSAGCHEARTVLPWLVGGAAVLIVLAMARLFGPVFVPPAVGSWLLTTPADRATLLRPRLIWTTAVAGVAAAVLAGVAAALGGFPVAGLLAFTASAALLALAAVSFAALSQARGGTGTRVLIWLLCFALWLGLLMLALRQAPITEPPESSVGWQIGLVAGLLLAVGLLVRSVRRLGRLGKHHVSPGGSLAPGLSGALATLDLALVYDVLLAHRWHRHLGVRPRRGGPDGPNALVWTDLVRLRRSPQSLVALAGAVVVPYAAEASGLGRVSLLVGALAGFLAALPLLSAMRVVTRTPGLIRMLPFPVATTRLATLAVPGGALAVFGLATAPAAHRIIDLPWTDAVIVGLAVGGCGLAAAARWVTGRPPDYTKPLVSTPAGGVPTNLYGSVIRGFDILLVTTAPLLVAPTSTGALISLALTLAVVSYLVGRE